MSEYPTTDNHKFARPEPGTLTDNWGSIINRELIDLLEKRVVVIDDANQRSDYEPYDGALFFARNIESWYIGDGEKWNQVAATGDSVDVLTVNSSINNRVQAWDADSLQAELTHDNPVEIELCSEIDVSDLTPIVLGSNKRIVNKGGKRGNAIVNNSTNDTFHLDNTRDIEFIGVSFDGDWDCPYHFTVNPNNTDQRDNREITFERCYFQGYSTAAYHMTGQWRVKFSNTQIEGDQQARHGIVVERANSNHIGNNQLRITNESDIFEHTSHGIVLREIGGFAMQASTSEVNQGAGIYVPDNGYLGGADITDSFFENNNPGVYIGTGRIRISGGKWWGQKGGGTLADNESAPHLHLGPNAKATINSIWCDANNGNTAILTDSSGGPHTFIKCRDGGDGVEFNHVGGTAIDCTFDYEPGLSIRNNRLQLGPAEDVTAIDTPSTGEIAFHDGSDNLPRGLVYYDAEDGNWISAK